MAVKKPTHCKIDMEFGNFAEFHASKNDRNWRVAPLPDVSYLS
jgi:hypothetical protein